MAEPETTQTTAEAFLNAWKTDDKVYWAWKLFRDTKGSSIAHLRNVLRTQGFVPLADLDAKIYAESGRAS